jgi:hypothetical protein
MSVISRNHTSDLHSNTRAYLSTLLSPSRSCTGLDDALLSTGLAFMAACWIGIPAIIGLFMPAANKQQ